MGRYVSRAWGPLFGRVLTDVHARLAAADPGLLRLQLSMRGTLSVVLATAAALAAGHYAGFNPAECAGGIVLSLMIPFLSREPTRQQRLRSLAALAAPAIGASVLTAVLHGRGPAGDSVFLLLVFGGFLLGPRSSGGVALGLVAVITTYVGLFLQLPPATLPIQLASEILVLPIIAFACFVLVPISPARTLRHAVIAVQARAVQVLRRAGTQDAAGMRRELLRLTEAALAADDQLALIEPGLGGPLRARLVEVELWAARLDDALRHGRGERETGGRETGGRETGGRERARIALHAERIGRGGSYASRPGQFVRGSSREALVGLGSAVHALVQAARLPVGTGTIAPMPAPPGPLAWRVATRVTLAAALAMAGGMALSPQRWFWAVITVYVMFVNARTRGDTIHKGAQRVAGTLIGIVTGFALAVLASGDLVVESVALVVSVWAMYYFFLVSYTAGIFFVTVMLGLVYGMLGTPVEQVLALRLEETAIGAAAAILVAFTVLPTRTRDQVRRSGLAVADGLAQVLRAISAAATSGPTPAVLMRRVDRSVADLKLALAPLVAGRVLLRRAPADRRASALLDCVHWTRMMVADHGVAPGTLADADGHVALAARLEGLASRLDALSRGDASPRPVLSVAGPAQVSAVERLDQAILLLAERLDVSAYDAFMLDR